MVDLQRGFVLTRHWRDTPAGTEVEFWLATDTGPRRIRLPWQPSVAFIPQAQREQAEALLQGEKTSNCDRWPCRISSIVRCSACIASSMGN